MSGVIHKRAGNIAGVIVVVGYVLLIVIVVTACAAIYSLDISQQISATGILASSVPTATLVPHILPGQPPGGDKILEEHFSDNQNGWTDIWQGAGARCHVKDGSLTIESLVPHNYALANCTSCPSLTDHFYLQADFVTDRITGEDYGMAFQLPNYYLDRFYAFLINTKNSNYYFYDNKRGDWALLTSGQNDLIRPYPNSNTLGLYVQNDFVELYINGTMVDTYQETKAFFSGGKFGFYVNNAGPELIVRNVLAYTFK